MNGSIKKTKELKVLSDMGLRDMGLSDMGLSDMGLSDMGLSDMGPSDMEFWKGGEATALNGCDVAGCTGCAAQAPFISVRTKLGLPSACLVFSVSDELQRDQRHRTAVL